MIRINCQTFEWGWEVTITRVTGLKEMPLTIERFQKYALVDTPGRAIRAAMDNAYDFLQYDLPETPEHS